MNYVVSLDRRMLYSIGHGIFGFSVTEYNKTYADSDSVNYERGKWWVFKTEDECYSKIVLELGD